MDENDNKEEIKNEEIDTNKNETVKEEVNDLLDKAADSFENFIASTNHENKFDKEEAFNYKTDAIISYIPFVCLYEILINKWKKSEYLKFHVNQGLVLTLLWFLSLILNRSFFSNIFISFMSYLLICCCLLLSLFGIVNTNNGESKELPLIGKIKLIKK